MEAQADDFANRIDLRASARFLARRGWLLALLTALFAGGGGAITLLSPRWYSCSALVLLNTASLREVERSPVLMGPEDARPAFLPQWCVLPCVPSMEEAVCLANAAELTGQVRRSIAAGPGGAPSARMVASSATSRQIRLTVVDADPNRAAAVANAWAEALIEGLNRRFSGGGAWRGRVEAELTRAEEATQKAEQALAARQAASRAPVLEVEVEVAREALAVAIRDRSGSRDEAEARLSKLLAELELARGELRIAQRTRDRARGVWDALATHLEHMESVGRLNLPLAELVASAMPADRPVERGLVRNVVMGGVLGLLVALGIGAMLGSRRARGRREGTASGR